MAAVIYLRSYPCDEVFKQVLDSLHGIDLWKQSQLNEL